MFENNAHVAAAINATRLEAVEAPNRHDAIIIGAGAAGCMAAHLLAQAGMRVLVLDAGYRSPVWRTPMRRALSTVLAVSTRPEIVNRLPPGLVWKADRATRMLGAIRQPVQSKCYAWPSAPELFVDDRENPYETPPDAPFEWIRARGLGGRVAVPLHGRQYYRHGRQDFRPVDGLSPAWPFAPEDLDPHYELVEGLLKLSGRAEGDQWVPDSRLAEVREPSPREAAFIARLRTRYPNASTLLGRFAPPPPMLAWAAETGRLLCRTGAIVSHIERGADGRVGAVVFHDRRADAHKRAQAPLVFLCASTLESTRILLNSREASGHAAFCAQSDALGRHLMDHIYLKAEGVGPDVESGGDALGPSRCIYLPRFDLRDGAQGAAGRGFGVRVYQSPHGPGQSYFVAAADSEMLPRPENRVTLSNARDAFGLRTLRIECRHSEEERARATLLAEALTELAAAAEVRLKDPVGGPWTPGSAIHECGTARMGDDPSQSALDPHNQCWDMKGLYVTDGSAFPSQGIQNPTLTILALTARACAHAAKSV